MAGTTLKMDPAKETRKIVAFIRQTVDAASADGVVIGLSGGVDSAVAGALCVKALGKGRVVAILLPSAHTPSNDTLDAEALVKAWGIEKMQVEISPLVQGVVSSFGEAGSRIAVANVQARLRMVLVYYVANSRNLLVAGTGDRSEELLGFFCYDKITRVVTPEGPKYHNELKKGDTIFSYDRRTGMVVESKVDEVFSFDYDDELVHFRGAGTDLAVTPNHRMLIRTTSDPTYSRVVFRTAGECLALKKVVVPVPSGWAGKPGLPDRIEIRFKQKHIHKHAIFDIDEILYVIGLFIGDGLVVKGKVVESVVSGLSRGQYTSLPRDSQGRFVLLPKNMTAPSLKTYDTFETDFALPIPDKNEARTKLIRTLEKYGVGYSLTANLVRIPSKEIYEFFRQFGVGAHAKHIPDWVLSYSSVHLAFLMRGLKDSDGAHAQDVNVYYTSSERLKDDFCELAVKLGRYPTVRERPPRVAHYKGQEIRSGLAYEISYGKGGHYSRTLAVARAKKLKYRGKVWCPSAPPHENILVERNGHYVFSGNTKFGDGGVDFLPIAHLYKTQVRELGRFLGLPERVAAKPASPQLWPGHTAREELPADYDTLDLVLHYLFDLKVSPSKAAARASVPRSVVDKVLEMHRRTAHKRSTPPSIAP